ncbi:hypothetical protein P368_14865 [Comamonas thiooxydans]|nr:hypothetical protein P365_16205 [Comamonas thiooxydans]KGH11342.1 hypothetical protein P368_14865 [Comamonas thiooxydans]
MKDSSTLWLRAAVNGFAAPLCIVMQRIACEMPMGLAALAIAGLATQNP